MKIKLPFPIKIDQKMKQSSGMVVRVTQEVDIHSKQKHPSILENRKSNSVK